MDRKNKYLVLLKRGRDKKISARRELEAIHEGATGQLANGIQKGKIF